MQNDDPAFSVPDAFWRVYLVAHYEDLLKQIASECRRRGIHGDFSQDVFHETAKWIIEDPNRFDPEEGVSPYCWFIDQARKILQHQLRAKWRSNAHEQQVIPIEGETPADAFERLAHRQHHPSNIERLRDDLAEVMGIVYTHTATKTLARVLSSAPLHIC